MGIRENYDRLNEALPYLKYNSSYISGDGKNYKISNINNIKKGVEILEGIDFLNEHIQFIKENTGLYETYKDEELFTSIQDTYISRAITNLRIGISFLLDYFRFNSNQEIERDGISIRLPELENFDDLAKVSNDFKKAIELPLADSKIDNNVKIISAEQGSIWLIIGLGSLAAVKLVAAICWAAMVIRKKRAEAKIFEAHATTLELKNDAIKLFVDAQNQQLKQLLNAEAEAIASEHYDGTNPEAIKRLELSINTTASLIEKGAKILPSNENSPVKENFPDYQNLNLIQTAIKQIRDN